MRIAVLGMVVLLSLAGCGGASSGDAPATGGDSVADSTGSGEVLCTEGDTSPECTAPPPQEGQLVTPSPGTVDARPTPWERFEAADDGSRLLVTYTGGVDTCYALDRVEVTETAEQVMVTVFEGVIPAAQNQPCIEIAVTKTVEVELSAPLGDRTVVDGAGEG